MKNLKYGSLTVIIIVVLALVISTRPTRQRRNEATDASNSILESYNKEDIDAISYKLATFPDFIPPDQLELKRHVTGEMLRILRQATGSCPVEKANYQVHDFGDLLRVGASITCENANARLVLTWVVTDDRLVLANLVVSGETIAAIPDLKRYVGHLLREREKSSPR